MTSCATSGPSSDLYLTLWSTSEQIITDEIFQVPTTDQYEVIVVRR